MIYAVTHRTVYGYGAPVSDARCALRLLPVDRARQRVLSAELLIDPSPAERRDIVDFFGNQMVLARFGASAARHVFEARARVEIVPIDAPHPALTPMLADIARSALADRTLAGIGPAHFLYPSRHVPALAPAREFAADIFAPDRPVLDVAIVLMRRIHAEFVYDSGATDVSTPLDRVFERRRGVCQDFAHAMIAVLRAHGVPALYVSGYLRTLPAPGAPRLVGADASHAWVSVWCGPGIGFVDLDPTNALMVGEDHVTLAVGRDYADVAPVSGVVTAAAGHSLAVSVDMAPEG